MVQFKGKKTKNCINEHREQRTLIFSNSTGSPPRRSISSYYDLCGLDLTYILPCD